MPVHTLVSIREILLLYIFNRQMDGLIDDGIRSLLKHSTLFFFFTNSLKTVSHDRSVYYMWNTHEAQKQHEMFHYIAFQRQSYITIQKADLQIWRDRCQHNPRPTRHCKNHIRGSQVNIHLANFSSLLHILSMCGSKKQQDVFVHSVQGTSHLWLFSDVFPSWSCV